MLILKFFKRNIYQNARICFRMYKDDFCPNTCRNTTCCILFLLVHIIVFLFATINIVLSTLNKLPCNLYYIKRLSQIEFGLYLASNFYLFCTQICCHDNQIPHTYVGVYTPVFGCHQLFQLSSNLSRK